MKKLGRPVTNRDCFISDYHLRLLYKIAIQIASSNPGVSVEELVDVAYLRYLRYFEDPKGKGMAIRSLMITWIKRYHGRRSLSIDDDSFVEVPKNHPRNDSDWMVEQALKRISNKRSRNLLMMYYFGGETQKNMSEKLGVTRQAVTMAISKARKEIREGGKL